MTWQLWELITIIITGFIFSSAKFIRKKVSAPQMLFWQFLGSVPTVGLINYFFNNENLIPENFYIPVLYGMGILIGGISLYNGVAHNLSKTMVVYSFKSHLTLLLFIIFLGEISLFDPKSLGGIINIISVILASLAIILIQNSTSKSKGNKWFIYATTALISVGIFNFISKLLLKGIDPIHFALGQFLGGLILLPLIIKFQKTNIFKNVNFKFINIIRGSIMSIGITCGLIALKNGPGSLVIMMDGIGKMILPILFGLVVFKENKSMSFKNYLGLIIGIISVILISISQNL